MISADPEVEPSAALILALAINSSKTRVNNQRMWGHKRLDVAGRAVFRRVQPENTAHLLDGSSVPLTGTDRAHDQLGALDPVGVGARVRHQAVAALENRAAPLTAS